MSDFTGTNQLIPKYVWDDSVATYNASVDSSQVHKFASYATRIVWSWVTSLLHHQVVEIWFSGHAGYQKEMKTSQSKNL